MARDQYCPIYRSLDLFGDRWGLLIVREILRGITRFNELERSLPGISRSTLAQRLRHLEKEGIVTRSMASGRAVDYALTAPGRDLVRVLEAVNDWGLRWLIPDLQPSEADPDGLMLWISRHVILPELPAERVVVRFELKGGTRRLFWLVLRSEEASLCPEHPGFAEDVFIAGTTSDIYRLFVGRQSLQSAINEGTIVVQGPPALLREVPRWFRLRPTGPSVPAPIA